MKKLIFLLTISLGISEIQAQDNRWFAGVDFKVGQSEERLAMRPDMQIYDRALNPYRSSIDTKESMAYGAGAQIGYYFSRNRHWGISVGFMYMRNQTVFTVDSLHVEYRSVDFNKDTFRQVISTSRPLTEDVTTDMINIPLLLRYRTYMSREVEFLLDFGILYNVTVNSIYMANAAFNYEALYKFMNINGNYEAVYDYSPDPHVHDWKLTRGQAIKDRGEDNVNTYFQELQADGYNVALDEEATNNTSGEVTHKKGTVGFLIQPSFNISLSKSMSFKVGPYLMFQRFISEENQQKMLTDKTGEYNTLLNNIISRNMTNYGLNVGISYSF